MISTPTASRRWSPVTLIPVLRRVVRRKASLVAGASHLLTRSRQPPTHRSPPDTLVSLRASPHLQHCMISHPFHHPLLSLSKLIANHRARIPSTILTSTIAALWWPHGGSRPHYAQNQLNARLSTSPPIFLLSASRYLDGQTAVTLGGRPSTAWPPQKMTLTVLATVRVTNNPSLSSRLPTTQEVSSPQLANRHPHPNTMRRRLRYPWQNRRLPKPNVALHMQVTSIPSILFLSLGVLSLAHRFTHPGPFLQPRLPSPGRPLTNDKDGRYWNEVQKANCLCQTSGWKLSQARAFPHPLVLLRRWHLCRVIQRVLKGAREVLWASVAARPVRDTCQISTQNLTPCRARRGLLSRVSHLLSSFTGQLTHLTPFSPFVVLRQSHDLPCDASYNEEGTAHPEAGRKWRGEGHWSWGWDCSAFQAALPVLRQGSQLVKETENRFACPPPPIAFRPLHWHTFQTHTIPPDDTAWLSTTAADIEGSQTLHDHHTPHPLFIILITPTVRQHHALFPTSAI